MANPSKDKGDRAERESVALLLDLLPEYCRDKSKRFLGAGRLEDEGDLYVLPDAAIQVKFWDNISAAIRTSAHASVVQAGHGEKEYALGLVKISGARANQVRWLACVAPGHWPVETEPVAEFAMASKALKWLKDDAGPYGYRVWNRLERIGLLAGPGDPAIVAPIEAWAEAYRQAHGTVLRAVA